MILKWMFEDSVVGVDGIDVAQDRDKWPAFVNAVMNLWAS
jgi:hypothetical protein